MSDPYRVIQWGTGATGRYAVGLIQEDPRLQLVGCRVHTESKHPGDIGELYGIEPAGFAGTSDSQALIAMDADAVLYAPAAGDPVAAFEEIATILASGKNLVTMNTAPVHPGYYGADVVARLDGACREGGSSFLASGLNPGTTQEIINAVLSSTRRAEGYSVHGMWNLEGYDGGVGDGLGIGLTREEAATFDVGPIWHFQYAPAVRLGAEWIGIELDDIETRQHLAFAEEDIEVDGASIAAGCVHAMRCDVMGMVGGKPRITQSMTMWVGSYPDHSLALPDDRGGYQLHVYGEPEMHLTWSLQGEPDRPRTPMRPDAGPTSNTRELGMEATAVRNVNEIPVLCEAEPGVYTPFSLPRIKPAASHL